MPVFPLLLLAGEPGPAKVSEASADSFETTVQPFLAKNCFLCHSDRMKTADLDLEAYTSTDAVARDREKWEHLLKKLEAGEMPPKGMPRPDPAAVKAVTQWVRAEFAREDARAQPEAGRVTARRLNRAEYNNTIRDLLGVDTHPADKFPQDDSGYGFDDIGDVLSLSPALMENYLGAADKVVHQALFGPPAMKATLVKLRGGPGKIKEMTVPPGEYDETGLTMPNAVHTTYRFPVDAQYTIRVVCGGFRPSGSEPLQIGLWLDGKQIQAMELDPGDQGPSSLPGQQDLAGKPREYRLRIPGGDHWLAASILHLYDGLPPSYGGPSPSRRPIPVLDASSFFKPPVDATPERMAAYRKRLDDFLHKKQPINQAKVNYIEVLGPYDEAQGSSNESRKLIYTCGHLDGHHHASCTRKIVGDFARRAFRRPVTQEELSPYLKLASMARKQGDGFEGGIGLALQAILVSPDFLFRIERDPGTSPDGQAYPISPFELASRLSYFLWSSMPDEELLSSAGRGDLRRPEQLAAQVKRMLLDPKSEALVENFGGQWLQFRALESAEPDHDRFPEFGEYLRMSMRRETELFLTDVVRNDRSILDILDGKYTFLNERLAQLYGIAGVKGPEFRKVDLSGNAERGGVLGQASVLTVSSYATRTSPVIRGKWILENILNDPVPPPPPGVPNLDVAEVGTSVSLRQQLEKHRANPVCASCHQRMDPLGFGLENYNAIGEWRDKDGKFAIDASGVLPDGRQFNGPAGLKAILTANRDAFARCMTEKLLTYALGRGVESYDRPVVNVIVRQLAAGDYRFASLVLGIVNSMPFQMQEERRERAKADVHHS